MSQIHQEVTFAASPSRVYRALMESAQHASFTNAPAEISGEAGGAFSAYGGRVGGRNVELVQDALIVQAWRAANWPKGVYSITRYELRADGDGTTMIFEQDGVPEDQVPHIDAGWQRMYWEPMARHLGA